MAKELRCWERGCPAKVLRCVIIATETLPLCGSPVLFGVSVRSTERANYMYLCPPKYILTLTFFFFFKDTANSSSATERLKILKSLVNALKMSLKRAPFHSNAPNTQIKRRMKTSSSYLWVCLCPAEPRTWDWSPGEGERRAEQSARLRPGRVACAASARASLWSPGITTLEPQRDLHPDDGGHKRVLGRGLTRPWGLLSPHPAEGSERVARTRARSLLPAWHGW